MEVEKYNDIEKCIATEINEYANQEIYEARRQQNVISNISSNATDRFNIRNSMSAINGNRRGYLLSGGYNQSATRIGRHGMSIELIDKARSIIKAQKGIKLSPLELTNNKLLRIGNLFLLMENLLIRSGLKILILIL